MSVRSHHRGQSDTVGFELQISDVAFGGKGIGRHQGKATFVPFAVDGERVRAKIVREKRQFAEAELLAVIDPSPDRVLPECPYFGRCGGCSYQHIRYAHQLELKTRQVAQAMQRIGRISAPPMRAIIPSPKTYGYRNRITVHAQDNIVGFYQRDSHRLLDIEVCPISAPGVQEALKRLRATRVRDGHYSLRAHPGPRVFVQANAEVAAQLANLMRTIAVDRAELLLDAYCGSGFFAKRLRDRFDRVVGIDWDRFAIAAAQENAAANESYIAGDVGAELRSQLERAPLNSTAVIVDPPASGLAPEVQQALLDFTPENLLYVSCNPPTAARDIAALQKTFSVISITPADMFPQTAEIEVMIYLRARNLTPQ